MPFKSTKQRAWMYVNDPEMAKEWEKETPKGKKLPKYAPKNKKKSVLEQIRLIIAEEVNVQQPAQPQVQPAQGQAPMDLNAANTLVPQLVKSLGTRNMQQIRQEMVSKYNVPDDLAQQATLAFGVKIFKEESQKRQQQIVNEVAKQMGLNPADLSKSSPLPPLPASSKRKLLLAKIVVSELQKVANQFDSVLEQASNKSSIEKAKDLYKFVTSVGPEEAASKIVDFADKVLQTLPKKSLASRTTIAIDNKTAMLGVLWAIALMSIWTVFNDKMSNALDAYGVAKGYWQLHPDKAEQAYNYAQAIKMVGVAGLASVLSIFMKKKEQPQAKRLYEGKL